MLELHLLGTVSLRRDGAALSLPIKKTQALLLLAIAGRQPRARLVSLLWPALDEPTGRRNLRRELARLREIGAGDAVQAESDYLALGQGVATDVQQLLQALAQGRHADALTLWRGPPADGLVLDDAAAFLEWWQPEAERLRALRQRTLGALAAAQEAAGDAEAALAHVQTQLAEEPLQEQLHRDAMRLQARCGRREAALAQYERCRALLASELGLAPMAETEALATTLRAGPATAPAPPATSLRAATATAGMPQLPALLPFVGRESEIAALEMAWRAGRAVVIEGEGGLGKTRLATDFAAAHGPYARVRTRPGDGAVPYAAFARALRELAGPQPDFTALPGWAQAELARVLPELGAPPPPIRHPQERGRFIEACAQAWLLLAADSFDAVILDDWHHADHASAELLAFVAQRRREQHPASAREWLLLRPEMPEPVRQSLQRLQAGADALHLQLAPLADAAVFELVQCLSGVAEPRRFAARLGHATRGNPFFMAETLRHLAEHELLSLADDGSWRTPFDDATDDYRELPVPRSVHEAVLERVQRLPAAARRVLEAAALAAEPFLPALLAPACALSELDTVLAIDEAVQVQLLREHEQGGYAFAHDLVQQALEGSLPDARRRLVHRRLALGAEAARAAPARIAAHHEASGDLVRAVVHRIAAGEQAWALLAMPEAIAHWQQALADGATPAQAMDLHRHLMRAASLSGLEALSLEHARQLQALVAGPALSTTQSADDRVLVLTDVARHLSYLEQQPQALAILEGLPAATTDLQRARVLAVRAEVQRELGHVDEAVAAASSALELQALQARERAGLMSTLALTLHQAGRLPEAVQVLKQCAELSAELRDDLGTVRARYQLGTLLAGRDDQAAEGELLGAASLAERVGAVTMQRSVLYSLCTLYANQTRPAQVLEAATRGWQLQSRTPTGGLRVMYRLAFVDAHHALGDLGAAWEHAAAVVAEAGSVNEVYVQVSTLSTSLELLTLLGEQALARPLLQIFGPDVLRQMPQHANDLWLARAKSALLQQDTAAAEQALAQVTGDIGLGRVACFDAQVRAELALAHGDIEAALALLPHPQAEGMSDESRLRALALRVQACTRGGGVLDAELRAAVASALNTDPVHATAALYLHAALAGAAAAGVTGAPATAAADAAAHLARLCASLQAHPAQQAALRRTYAALTTPAAPPGSPGASVRR